MVIYWFVDPIARRERWIRWYALGIVLAAAIVFEPLRETFLFGQVNMYLVALVGADLLVLTARGSRFHIITSGYVPAGVGSRIRRAMCEPNQAATST